MEMPWMQSGACLMEQPIRQKPGLPIEMLRIPMIPHFCPLKMVYLLLN